MAEHVPVIAQRFTKLASSAAAAAGHWLAFSAAVLIVVLWAVTGLFVGYGNTLFQLAINTGTTIVTFLMVFLIQGDANRSDHALHAKLDELIHAIDAADDRVAGIEHEEQKPRR
jgi:low affinity Fe/Cu permease